MRRRGSLLVVSLSVSSLSTGLAFAAAPAPAVEWQATATGVKARADEIAKYQESMRGASPERRGEMLKKLADKPNPPEWATRVADPSKPFGMGKATWTEGTGKDAVLFAVGKLSAPHNLDMAPTMAQGRAIEQISRATPGNTVTETEKLPDGSVKTHTVSKGTVTDAMLLDWYRNATDFFALVAVLPSAQPSK